MLDYKSGFMSHRYWVHYIIDPSCFTLDIRLYRQSDIPDEYQPLVYQRHRTNSSSIVSYCPQYSAQHHTDPNSSTHNHSIKVYQNSPTPQPSSKYAIKHGRQNGPNHRSRQRNRVRPHPYTSYIFHHIYRTDPYTNPPTPAAPQPTNYTP